LKKALEGTKGAKESLKGIWPYIIRVRSLRSLKGSLRSLRLWYKCSLILYKILFATNTIIHKLSTIICL
jgi:hypothetical protein